MSLYDFNATNTAAMYYEYDVELDTLADAEEYAAGLAEATRCDIEYQDADESETHTAFYNAPDAEELRNRLSDHLYAEANK